MTTFATSEEWLEKASLLVQAYPSTTKITSRYNVPSPSKPRKRKAGEEGGAKSDGELVARPAQLEVRAYEPSSGVVLKYSTNKQQDVGRLIASLGRIGRHMAALPKIAEDTATLDAVAENRTSTPVPETTTKEVKPAVADSKGGQGGGGGKKKKKGKK